MMKVGKLQQAGLALLLVMASGVANASIVRAYDDPTGSGVVTYSNIGSNQLQIEIDNTTDGSLYSSLITGLNFDIVTDINAMTVASFEDGNGADLLSSYSILLNVSNNATPGNANVDVAIATTNGVNGGIYNSANPGSNISNAAPDIAILILTITDPVSWDLSGVSNDVLRMQRTDVNGEGSLKIPGVPGVPVPAAVWLFGSGLLGLVGVARRKRA